MIGTLLFNGPSSEQRKLTKIILRVIKERRKIYSFTIKLKDETH